MTVQELRSFLDRIPDETPILVSDDGLFFPLTEREAYLAQGYLLFGGDSYYKNEYVTGNIEIIPEERDDLGYVLSVPIE